MWNLSIVGNEKGGSNYVMPVRRLDDKLQPSYAETLIVSLT